MVVGILQLDFHIPLNNSLKGKRRALKSIKERLRNKFNISVAEVDNHDLWQRATLGISSVSTDKNYIHKLFSKVIDTAKKDSLCQLIDFRMEIL